MLISRPAGPNHDPGRVPHRQCVRQPHSIQLLGTCPTLLSSLLSPARPTATVQVWPSFWTQRVNRTWPYGGEIDIIETVNLMPSNQYALHTGNSACIASASATQSGAIVNANCSTPPGSSSAGCTIVSAVALRDECALCG